MNKRLALAAMAASLYSPYIYDLVEMQRSRRRPNPQPAPLTPGQRRLFIKPDKQLYEFSIKGHKIMAFSRKDAIKRLKHQKKI